MERILIVDDEPAIRTLMRRWIDRDTFVVTEAGSAGEALAAAAAEPPSVVLIDIRLPGRDGLWLARELHRLFIDAEPALIMTTGVRDFSAAVASLQSGAIDYLLKPFEGERLVAAVQKGVEWHRARVADTKLRADVRARADQVSMTLAELEINSTAAVDAMRNMLAIRDSAAYDTGTRVAKLAVDLALALGIKEPVLSEIERAALLHDLGKLAAPETLLHKTTPLSRDEQEIVRGYPRRAYDTLQSVPFLAEAAELVLASHEHVDGSGYPAGLHEREIPLGARVLALAKAFDAMTHPRPFQRQPMSAELAVAEVVCQRGRQFDPAVVDAFLKLHGRDRREGASREDVARSADALQPAHGR